MDAPSICDLASFQEDTLSNEYLLIPEFFYKSSESVGETPCPLSHATAPFLLQA